MAFVVNTRVNSDDALCFTFQNRLILSTATADKIGKFLHVIGEQSFESIRLPGASLQRRPEWYIR